MQCEVLETMSKLSEINVYGRNRLDNIPGIKADLVQLIVN